MKETPEPDITVYIGWDSREAVAADVCRASLLAHASVDVKVVFLKQNELRNRDIYTRDVDELASTEFTFTRFLVPYLQEFSGYAIFVDCDFVWRDDIGKLLKIAKDNPMQAVHVVQHDYTPTETVKMDGQAQHIYPRKNWSSMIVWNCEHPGLQALTKEHVNTYTGEYLHRFKWLHDNEIGSLSNEWNWLVGWYKEPQDGVPKAIHYTLGGPWFDQYKDCEYADVWNFYKTLLGKKTDAVYVPENLTIPPDLLQTVVDYFTLRYDRYGMFNNLQQENVLRALKIPKKPGVIAVLDGLEILDEDDPEDITLKNDKILENFVIGADGSVGRMSIVKETPISVPIVLRGITKRKVMHRCKEEGRDYYYVDTGYFGNDKKKDFHRVTKNAMQYLGKLDPNCPEDRFLKTRTTIYKHTPGSKILICPPSQKAMKFWNMDVDNWLQDTVKEIRKHTDREIEIRKKGTRSERISVDTMEMALKRDVHCMVTFNSIAAVESLIFGKPVFVCGPQGTNAAEPLANTDLSKIDNPFMPDYDQVRMLCYNLAYHQFTVVEMRSGYAWAMLNGKI